MPMMTNKIPIMYKILFRVGSMFTALAITTNIIPTMRADKASPKLTMLLFDRDYVINILTLRVIN
jgi:hypothetical protein